MTAFLWTMIAMFVIGVLGKTCMLLTQDRVRNLGLLPFDIIFDLAMMLWAVWLVAKL